MHARPRRMCKLWHLNSKTCWGAEMSVKDLWTQDKHIAEFWQFPLTRKLCRPPEVFRANRPDR